MHLEGYRAWRRTLRELGIERVEGLDLLEIGCGDRCQLSLMFAHDGAKVVGLDLLPVRLGRRRPWMWVDTVRSDGAAPALRLVVRDVVHTFRYWSTLRRRLRSPLPFDRVSLVRGDATRLPFADRSFDLVVSSAVWEHVLDVHAATREVARVLRPGGLAVIQIALFPSLQGGHHPDWHDPSAARPHRVRPWDHLREGHLPFPTILNELTEDAYRRVFEQWIDVLRWDDGEMRGMEFLTESIREELPRFPERDLLLSGVTVFGRPKASGAS